jgi:hypothetical protein
MIIRDGKAFDKNAIYRVVSSAFGRVAEAQLVGDLDRAGDVRWWVLKLLVFLELVLSETR